MSLDAEHSKVLTAERLRQWHILIDHILSPVFLTDARGRFVLVNPAMVTLVGVDSADALIGTEVCDLEFSDLGAAISVIFSEIEATRDTVQLREFLLRRGESSGWAAITVAPVCSNPELPLHGFIGFVLDIERRKRQEEQVETARRELEVREKDRLALVEKSRKLMAEIQAMSTRISAINEIAQAINQSLKLHEIVDVVGKQAKWLLDFDHCSICFVNEEGILQTKTFMGVPVEVADVNTPPGTALARAFSSGFPQIVHTSSGQGFLSEFESQMVVPIKSDGIVWGSVNVAARKEKAYSQEDLRIAYLLVMQMGAAVRNAQIFDELMQLNNQLKEARQRSEQLLRNILPVRIAEELKSNGQVKPVHYESATILFTDFVNFSSVASRTDPTELVMRLDYYFSVFDNICERHNLEKLKTIGDAYMCAGGIPEPNDTHALDAVRAAMEMVEFIAEDAYIGGASSAWNIRVGVHTGPLVAGVIGHKKFSYDIWGDAVNVAARMEQSGIAGRINISEQTYELVKDHIPCMYRGRIPVKNRGELKMFLVKTGAEDID